MAALRTQNEIDELSDHQKSLVMNTPRMRSIENRDEKDRLYQDDLIDAYIRKYTMLTKQLANDYKRHAINAFLTEMYCGDQNPKYSSKYKDLIEKALYGEEGWHKLK